MREITAPQSPRLGFWRRIRRLAQRLRPGTRTSADQLDVTLLCASRREFERSSSTPVIDRLIGIARPGDVVILRMRSDSERMVNETRGSIERLQAKFPGVGFVVIGDDMGAEIKAGRQDRPGARR